MKRPSVHVLRARPRFRGGRTPVVTVGQSVRRLVLVGAASAAMAAVVFVVTVLTPEGQRLADLILYGRPMASPTVLPLAIDALASIDLTLMAVAVAGLALTALLLSGPGLMVVVLAAIVGANLTTQALKVSLERPNLIGDAAYALGNSFPSGHVTVVASLSLTAILVVPRRMRGLAAGVAGVLMTLIGVSAVAAGWHRVGDVAGAILITLAWVATLTAMLGAFQGRMPRRTWAFGTGSSVTAWSTRLAAAMLLVGGVGIAAAWVDTMTLPAREDRLALAPLAFAAAVLVIGGTALPAAAGLPWGMRGLALERRPGGGPAGD